MKKRQSLIILRSDMLLTGNWDPTTCLSFLLGLHVMVRRYEMPASVDGSGAETKSRRRACLTLGAFVPVVAVWMIGVTLLQGERLPSSLQVPVTKNATTNETIVSNVLSVVTTKGVIQTPLLLLMPEACSAYIIQGDTLSLKHGRYIHIPGRQPPYDHNSCFLMKPRYNCAVNESTTAAPMAYEWKFILQSNWSDESTICDIQAVVDDLGGPAAIPNKQVALFGNSILRQVFEALACKYQEQLTRVLVMEDPPAVTLVAVRKRGGKPYASQEYGNVVSLPLEKRPIPHCSGIASEFAQYFHPGVILSTPHFTDSCSDDLAMMEFNNSTKLYYNFHPERLQDTVRSYQKMIQLNMSELDYIAVSNLGIYASHFRKSSGLAITASFDTYINVIALLKRILKRDAGHWFGATNPWIVGERDPLHPCLPGIPDDEVAILLFSVIFGIHKFVVK